MSTKRTANIYVKNNSGGNAAIQMSHQYDGYTKPDTGAWQAAPGQTVGPLVVHFETGIGTGFDWWWLNMQVKDGPNAGNYASRGTVEARKECMLRASDSGPNIVNTVDTKSFGINLVSGGCSASMVRTGNYSPITNVFVLMLENHSFDVALGNSKISGKDSKTGKPTTINGLTGNETNTYNGTTYKPQPQSRDPMLSDPGHEFMDTLQQLTGWDPKKPYPGKYPAINNSGFAANYATTTTEGPAPPAANIGDIMGGYNNGQIPVLSWLAARYAVCDNWYSSIPGPTWPNRFFAMGASSEGVDFSPSRDQIIGWESPGGGFSYVNGSLFDLLRRYGLDWRLYGDVDDQFSPRHGSPIGSIPIATALKNITVLDVNSFAHFGQDLQSVYPYQFTWIEPNYGDASTDFKYGSSQHPMDSLNAGEQLIYSTYNSILNSPLWPTSLLIITYDEHGGYYDHVAPPPAIPPGDSNRYDQFGFQFDQYGVRVPTVVVSPQIPANTIDHTLYDHASIPKTVETLFGLPNLTKRDASANSLFPLLKGQMLEERPEAPKPAEGPELDATLAEVDEAALDLQPLPENGNLNGFAMLALKAEADLSDGSAEAIAAIREKAEAIKTKGDARRYIREIVAKGAAARKALKK